MTDEEQQRRRAFQRIGLDGERALLEFDMPKTMLLLLRELARRERKSVRTLVKTWVDERLRLEREKLAATAAAAHGGPPGAWAETISGDFADEVRRLETTRTLALRTAQALEARGIPAPRRCSFRSWHWNWRTFLMLTPEGVYVPEPASETIRLYITDAELAELAARLSTLLIP